MFDKFGELESQMTVAKFLLWFKDNAVAHEKARPVAYNAPGGNLVATLGSSAIVDLIDVSRLTGPPDYDCRSMWELSLRSSKELLQARARSLK